MPDGLAGWGSISVFHDFSLKSFLSLWPWIGHGALRRPDLKLIGSTL